MRPASPVQSVLSRIRPRFSRELFSLIRHSMTASPPPPPAAARSVAELLQRRAAERAGQTAFVFLPEAGNGGGGDVAWTYAELDRRARAVAAAISRSAAPGDRAVLVFSPGLDFIAAFFGCLYAGVLPAPATYPKPRRPSPRLDAIVADCSPKLALTTTDTLAMLQLENQTADVQALEWLAVDACDEAPAYKPVARGGSDAAFLQYTSGSTSQPRGVVVTHDNLLDNLELIRAGFGLARADSGAEPVRGVFWLPAYHDMGLIGGILTPLYVGGTSYLLAPATFLQRPAAWLETLARSGATISGAPNFAYELCARKIPAEERARLDLSRWRLAFCGAEPIDAQVLTEFAEAFAPAGFREEAFYPCYGLAEATLLVSGGAGPGRPRVVYADRSRLAANELVDLGQASSGAQAMVGCGRPLGDQEVRIVDPKTFEPLGEGAVGEIWVRGGSVAAGYWNHPEERWQTFGGRLADGEGAFLRTGDLGSLLGGELFITGRLKDVIIIRARNLYPQDLERTAQQAHAAVELGAAFAVHKDGREELVIVHQVSREHRRDDMGPILRAIRAAIVEEHEVDPLSIVLLRPASLPLTSSGKVQRSRCRELFERGELDQLAAWMHPVEPKAIAETAPAVRPGVEKVRGPQVVVRPPRPKFLDRVGATSTEELAAEVQAWMLHWLSERVGVAAGELTPTSTFTELGMDSLTAVELNVEFENVLGVRLPPVAAWSYPTPAALSQYLAEVLSGTAPSDGPGGSTIDSWFEAMDADGRRL